MILIIFADLAPAVLECVSGTWFQGENSKCISEIFVGEIVLAQHVDMSPCCRRVLSDCAAQGAGADLIKSKSSENSLE